MGLLLLHKMGPNPAFVMAEARCQLANPPELFNGLVAATRGDPCTTGCVYFDKGKCPAYLKWHSVPVEAAWHKKQDEVRAHTDQSGLIGGKWSGMTIRQIAEKEGISLGEARRRKQAGAYQT